MSDEKNKKRINLNTRHVKPIKGASFTPIFYLYMGADQDGRYLGDILTYLVIGVSVIVGWITGEHSVDLVCWALSFGSFIYYYRVRRLMNEGCKTGYFTEGPSDFCFHTLKKFSGQMSMLSSFFENYSVFLISVLLPNIYVKIAAAVLFMGLILVLKRSNDLWEAWNVKKILPSAIKCNLLPLALIMVGGMIFSAILEIRPYYNIGFILIAASAGLLRYVLDKDIRKFFRIEQDTIKNKTHKMDVIEIAELFQKNITQKGEKTYKEIHEEKREEERRKEVERRDKMWKQKVKKDLDEMWERHEREQEESNKRMKEKKEKEREQRRLAEAKRKEYNGEKLTEEEKKVISKEEESIYKPSGLEAVSSDRTKARR